MFYNDLTTDLKKIFGVKKIIYSQVEYGQEQDVLYCNITTERNRPSHGFYYFRIIGSLGYNTQYGNTRKGWFHYKWLQSRYEHKERLQLGNYEINGDFPLINDRPYNKFFCTSKIEFVYTIKIPFDPSHKTKGFIAQIKKLFTKGGK